jgi:hypothetical protein
MRAVNDGREFVAADGGFLIDAPSGLSSRAVCCITLALHQVILERLPMLSDAAFFCASCGLCSKLRQRPSRSRDIISAAWGCALGGGEAGVDLDA